MTIELYDYILSANCYKVRLLLGFLDLDHEIRTIDFHPAREHKGEAFKRINPMGHIPVLIDDGFVLRDAHAILVYLAAAHDPSGRWYPTDEARVLGEIGQWLSFAEALMSSASAARLHVNLGYDLDVDAAPSGAHELFRVLDEHLWFQERQGCEWLCAGDHPTVADIAVFPDVVLSEEGGVSRLEYPAIRRWCDRVKTIPRFGVMPGVFGLDMG